MHKTPLSVNHRGDTIIEVLVALAVLGLAFSISYATANHALNVSQNSQEHSDALQIIDSQVELARADAGDQQLYKSQPFCMSSSTYKPVVTSNTACSPVNGGAGYHISVQYDPALNTFGVNQDIFTFTIKWQGLGSLGEQQEQVSYKIHDVADVNSGVGSPTLPSVLPASVNVVVKAVPPGPGNTTPNSCSAAASTSVSSTNVLLKDITTGTALAPQLTDNSSSTTFSGLTGGDTYTATGLTPPASYELCPDANTGSVTAVAGQTATIDTVKIRPICTTVTTGRWQYLGYYGGGWFLASQLPAYYFSYPYLYYYAGSGYYSGQYEYAYIYVYQYVTSVQGICPN